MEACEDTASLFYLWLSAEPVRDGERHCFFKGKNNPFLSQWMDITFNYPEVILDPSEEELSDQYPFFVLHKHDQVVLTALASYNMESCMILPELSETHGECVAIYASRIRAKSKYEYILEMAKRKMRK